MGKRTKYTGDDLTIVICAYKECDALEKCVQRIVKQSVKTHVMISTSTPNDHIQKIAQRYHIDVSINPEGGHVSDYNFALAQVKTKLGMIAHQDDYLHSRFVEKSLAGLNRASDPILSFTDYIEMHDSKVDRHPSGLVVIKRMLVWPMRIPLARRTSFFKRLGQCLGNPITHPTVICVMNRLPSVIFQEKYKASMDWDLWERLSREKGEFVYIPNVLLAHRMSSDNATAKILESGNKRYLEEYEILSRFWPSLIAKLIMIPYSKSAKYY